VVRRRSETLDSFHSTTKTRMSVTSRFLRVHNTIGLQRNATLVSLGSPLTNLNGKTHWIRVRCGQWSGTRA
jgi:hypothetical protein